MLYRYYSLCSENFFSLANCTELRCSGKLPTQKSEFTNVNTVSVQEKKHDSVRPNFPCERQTDYRSLSGHHREGCVKNDKQSACDTAAGTVVGKNLRDLLRNTLDKTFNELLPNTLANIEYTSVLKVRTRVITKWLKGHIEKDATRCDAFRLFIPDKY